MAAGGGKGDEEQGKRKGSWNQQTFRTDKRGERSISFCSYDEVQGGHSPHHNTMAMSVGRVSEKQNGESERSGKLKEEMTILPAKAFHSNADE
jgi:hypothetical protein